MSKNNLNHNNSKTPSTQIAVPTTNHSNNPTILVLGCGNILFGDDGFGPTVIEYLQKNYKLPENIAFIDAKTGIREILFDVILTETKPKKIIIVDSVDAKKKPGEIFEISIDELPKNKIDDFSMHQLPTSNLLKELKELCHIDIAIIACQVENIPQIDTSELSDTLKNAIPKTCELILKLVSNFGGNNA
ncbi:MAG: coenzyme F420-reducing hydrogenase, FrhD protein [Elusimicrobiota bacterium]